MYIKKLTVFSFLLLVVLGAKAQHYNLVIGPELSLPTGNSTTQSPIGYGGYVKGEIGLSPKFSITGSGGVVSFLGKKFLGPRAETLSYLPVKAGLKYYTDKNFYFEGQLGASIPVNETGATRFAWSPGAGTFIRSRNSNNQFDFGLRYEGWTGKSTFTSKTTTFGFFTFRAGYAFNL
ncbi:hypothetical protein WG904_17040 [Pedobacter sp. Du54]|uniref:hypothetical protein n=1 Tax=Pedobacter anseongensis TaxID=3133439 RepID=UPI0030A262E4